MLEDHLTLDERGDPLDRHVPVPDPLVETPLATPWREALGALLPLEATPLLTGAIEAVWPGIHLAWGPVTGDLVGDARDRASTLTEARARLPIRVGRAPATGARRALAQQLVREVLGLIGPAVRGRGRRVVGGESRDADRRRSWRRPLSATGSRWPRRRLSPSAVCWTPWRPEAALPA